jgi:hypothetical protein
MICQNKGQVNTVMGKAQDFFLDTPSNVGRWWIIPVIKGTGNCDAKDLTAVVDFAKIRVTDVVKNGSPKYIWLTYNAAKTSPRLTKVCALLTG